MLAAVAVLLGLMVLVALAPALLHRRRRRRWRRSIARIDAAYYAAPGKTALPLLDVSFDDHGVARSVKGLRRPGIDLEDLSPGDSIAILICPSDSRRCLIDG